MDSDSVSLSCHICSCYASSLTKFVKFEFFNFFMFFAFALIPATDIHSHTLRTNYFPRLHDQSQTPTILLEQYFSLDRWKKLFLLDPHKKTLC